MTVTKYTGKPTTARKKKTVKTTTGRKKKAAAARNKKATTTPTTTVYKEKWLRLVSQPHSHLRWLGVVGEVVGEVVRTTRACGGGLRGNEDNEVLLLRLEAVLEHLEQGLDLDLDSDSSDSDASVSVDLEERDYDSSVSVDRDSASGYGCGCHCQNGEACSRCVLV